MSAPSSDPISLETITGDLSTIGVFVDGQEYFICELRALAQALETPAAMFRVINQVETMAFEIKQRIAEMRSGLDEFIDAAPAAHLWAERKAQ